MSAACRYRLQASFRSVPQASHPDGPHGPILAAARAITALPLGWLDPDASFQVVSIDGASDGERCALVLQVLASSHERAEELLGEALDALNQAANTPGCSCDLQVRIDETPGAYGPAQEPPELLGVAAGASTIAASPGAPS